METPQISVDFFRLSAKNILIRLPSELDGKVEPRSLLGLPDAFKTSLLRRGATWSQLYACKGMRSPERPPIRDCRLLSGIGEHRLWLS